MLSATFIHVARVLLSKLQVRRVYCGVCLTSGQQREAQSAVAF